jgi:hypothetical protein
LVSFVNFAMETTHSSSIINILCIFYNKYEVETKVK